MLPTNESGSREERAGATTAHVGGTRRWFQRATYVASVFARYGFGPVMQRLGMGHFVPRRFKPSGEELSLPERLRLALEELGPVGVKLGQVLASRPDLLPAEYLSELRKLTDNVDPFPFEQAREVVEEELKASIEEVFVEFGQEPVAAASLGQVHKARLRTGQQVAVKVQRPDAAAVVEMDLQILLGVARLAERYSKALQEARVAEFALEFGHVLRNELNYYVEAYRTDCLREALARYDYAKVPFVYWNYTTRRVLVTEWCRGARLEELTRGSVQGINLKAAAHNIGSLLLLQIFVLGFFHGDPHPGNLLVQPGERIVLLDCGNVQSVSRKMRQSLSNLLGAVLSEDPEAVLDEILEIGVVSDDTDLQVLALDVDRMLSRYTSVRETEIHAGEVIDQMLSLVFRHRVRVPPVLGAMARTLLVGEGVCRMLDSDFDFRKVAAATLPAVVRGGLTGLTFERLRQDGHQMVRLARLLPRQLSRLLVRVNAGGVRVRMVMEDVDQALRRLDVMANRLAFGLVVAAFIMSSAVVISSERAMASLTPIGGTVYAGTAAVLGLWLLYSILRSGRL